MVKLKDAKCPNCGANIEVNDKLEKSICQYCGSTVMVDEAIEKYKLEISGKVEVEGIKGRSSKIKQAIKHKKLKEYDKATKILKEVIADDEFDIEALAELVKLDIDIIENSDFDENLDSRQSDEKSFLLIDEIINTYNRISDIDESEGETYDMLDGYHEKVTHYCDVANKLIDDNESLNKYLEKLNEDYDIVRKISDKAAEEWCKELSQRMHLADFNNYYKVMYRQPGATGFSWYRLSSFKEIARNGIIESHYRWIKDGEYGNPERADLWLTPEPDKEFKSLDEVKKALDEFLEFSNEYVEENSKTKNTEIDKANKRLDRKNTVIEAKIKMKYVKIAVMAFIILCMVIWSISILVKSFVGFIAFVILVDSWAISLPFISIQDTLYDIKGKKREKEINKSSKRDHVK